MPPFLFYPSPSIPLQILTSPLFKQNIATQQGPHKGTARDLYSRLRKNIVDTVYQSWEETGFAWEQYDPDTGKGQRTQHFTGWTSLVVKIMAMEDLGTGEGREGRVRDEL